MAKPFTPKGIKMHERLSFEGNQQNIQSIATEWMQARAKNKAKNITTKPETWQHSTKTENRFSILDDNKEQKEKERETKLQDRSGISSNMNTEKQYHINEIREDVLKELITRYTKDVRKNKKINEIKETIDGQNEMNELQRKVEGTLKIKKEEERWRQEREDYYTMIMMQEKKIANMKLELDKLK